MIIPSITLSRKKIDEVDALDKYESGPLWLIDEDYKNGRELNFKKYDELSGIYELYLDAEISSVDDVADAITGGATMVTVSEMMDREKLRRALFYTESLVLYVKDKREVADYFFANGGNKVYSDTYLFDDNAVQFTSKLNCDRCNTIIPIGGFDGRRNTEAPSLP